jgi:hypothetical protein
MLGYYLGVWGIRVVAFMQFFGWFGTGAKQILSSSSLFYSINQSWSMRRGDRKQAGTVNQSDQTARVFAAPHPMED